MLKEIMGHHTCFGSSESNLKRTPDRKAPSEPLGIPVRGGGSAARKGQSLLHPPFPHSNTSALYHSGHSAKTDFSVMILFRPITPKQHGISLLGGIYYTTDTSHCSTTVAVS